VFLLLNFPSYGEAIITKVDDVVDIKILKKSNTGICCELQKNKGNKEGIHARI
jgi:hypothetical protein